MTNHLIVRFEWYFCFSSLYDIRHMLEAKRYTYILQVSLAKVSIFYRAGLAVD